MGHHIHIFDEEHEDHAAIDMNKWNAKKLKNVLKINSTTMIYF